MILVWIEFGLFSLSSTANTMAATVQRQAPSIMDNSPRQIREALEQSDDWADFDILELERLTDKRYVSEAKEWQQPFLRACA